MSCWTVTCSLWLADFYITAGLLLVVALSTICLIREPVRRLAVAWATMLALAALLLICVLPAWPRVQWSTVLEHALAAFYSGIDMEAVPASSNRLGGQMDAAGAPRGEAFTGQPAAAPARYQLETTRGETAPFQASPGWGPQQWSAVIVGLFLGGVVLLGLWLCWGAVQTVLLCRGAGEAPAPLRAELARIVCNDGRLPRLLVHPGIDAAVALGVLQPTILLPSRFVQQATPRGLQAALAHEWAHIRNGDLWLLALGRCLLLVLFAQPVFWWLRRKIRDDQEALADAAVTGRTSRGDYAEELLHWARKASQRPAARVAAALGIWERPSQLSRRIAMLLDEKRPVHTKCSRRWHYTCSAMLVGFALTVSLLTLRPVPAAEAEPTQMAASEPSTADQSPTARQSTPTDQPPSAKPDSGSPKQEEALVYTCKLTDQVSGQPIEGATVTVRRSLTSPGIAWEARPVVAETTHRTDQNGRYTLTIPPEQAVKQYLYVEIETEHPDYVRWYGGYSFAMIRKNERQGGRPFFDTISLWPAVQLTGKVEKPDGSPAAGVKVFGYSKFDPEAHQPRGFFIEGRTDQDGVFRLHAVQGGKTVLWLLPKDYSPSTQIVEPKLAELGRTALEFLHLEDLIPKAPERAETQRDVGRFVLQQGITIRGRVLDQDGTPIEGVWVNADLREGPAKKEIGMNLADHIERSALTDAKGEFLTAPLPPGTYRVNPWDEPTDRLAEDDKPRPLPAVFLPQMVTLEQGSRTKSVEFRAVPHVTIEAQYLDSSGKPRTGHQVHFAARSKDGTFYWQRCRPDRNGKISFKAAKGLEKAELSLITNEHSALRHRTSKDAPLSNSTRVELGTLESDLKDIAIIRYTAPILLVSAVDENGDPIKGFRANIKYAEGRAPHPGEYIVDGKPAGDVHFERQADGRWRSEQLLPDEQFTFTVEADGYQPKSQDLSLAEGAIKELEWKLTKSN